MMNTTLLLTGFIKRYAFIALLVWLPVAAQASPSTQAQHVTPSIEHERAYLAKVIKELEAIKPLIEQAQRYHHPQRRVQFDYSALTRDIALLQAHITDYLQASAREPRLVAPWPDQSATDFESVALAPHETRHE